MSHKRLLSFVLVVLVLSAGFLFYHERSEAQSSLYLLDYPYSSAVNGKIHMSSGPHAFGDTNSAHQVSDSQASGIDLAGDSSTVNSNCGIPTNANGSMTAPCGFSVQSMAAGHVIYAGLGDFGNEVVVQLNDYNWTLVYGHLFRYSVKAGDPVYDGTSIGVVGGTATNFTTSPYSVYPGCTTGSGWCPNVGGWHVHLHIELRDNGSKGTCTPALCLKAYPSGAVLPVGNPVSWDGKAIGAWDIYAYHVSSLSDQIYNYDGVAINVYSGGASEDTTQVTNLSFVDSDGVKSGVTTQLPVVMSQICNTTPSSCNEAYFTQPNPSQPGVPYLYGVEFAAGGAIGGGGILYTTLPAQPGITTPTWTPTATVTATAGPINGVMPGDTVSVYTEWNYNINSGAHSQYGWHDPITMDLPSNVTNAVSSVGITPGWSIMLYEGTSETGGHLCVTANNDNLFYSSFSNGDAVNDKAQSVAVFHDNLCGGAQTVQPGDTVSVYSEWNYNINSGAHTQYGWHDPVSENTQTYMTNVISSVGITPGWSIMLYDAPNEQGGYVCLTANNDNLAGISFSDGANVNDRTQSVTVFHDSLCGGSTVPNAPSNLQVVGVFPETIGLVYTDNSANENGFHVYQWDGINGIWNIIDTYGANQNAVAVSNLICNTGYTFAVTAFNNAGDSSITSYVGVTTAACTPTNTATATVTNTATATTPSQILTLLVAPSHVGPGGVVTFAWVNPNPSGNDWVTMYQVGAPDSVYLSWQYANGNSGTDTFQAPSTPGAYEFRFSENGAKAGTTNPFYVVMPTATATLQATATKTATKLPPTKTLTPTKTSTPTKVPPTPTKTLTPVPPTKTSTPTKVPPTATKTLTPSKTATAVPSATQGVPTMPRPAIPQGKFTATPVG